MTSPCTDPLQDHGVRIIVGHRLQLPLYADCVHFPSRFNRVRSPGALQSGPKSVSNKPQCHAVWPSLFRLQLYQLMQLERRRKLIESGETDVLKMPSSCKDIRAALAACLQESDCVMIYRNKPSDCLRPPLLDEMPTKCQQLKKGYGQCKRGMVDMRKRFRGNQPVSVSSDLERGGQLYAGKPAFGSVVNETSGKEPVEKDWRELENEKYRKET